MMRGNRQVELKFEGMVSCDDMMTARALVEEDLGIGFLPAFLAEEAKVPLIRVLPELAHQISGIFFVYPAQRFVPQRVRNFIAYATGERRRP
jgi:DNA-binding transcriptional LysR family regulator